MPFDAEVYKVRGLSERVFNRLMNLRGIATRYDKTARNILAACASPPPAFFWMH